MTSRAGMPDRPLAIGVLRGRRGRPDARRAAPTPTLALALALALAPASLALALALAPAPAVGSEIPLLPADDAEPAPRPETGPAESTRAMAALLAELAAEVDPMETNFVVNDRRAERFGALVGHLPLSTDQLTLRLKYARALLGAGRFEDCIEVLDGIVEDAPEVGPAVAARARLRVLNMKAAAYLRMAEEDNCHLTTSEDACLLPLRGGGVHRDREGATAAIAVLEELLELTPDDLGARWLLNVAHMALGSYPEGVPERWRIPPETFDSEYPLPRFDNVALAAGLDIFGLSGGAILEDLDGDRRLDLMVSHLGLDDQTRFFHNRGDGLFEDRTQAAGIVGEVGGLNMVSTDYDNDGRVDVLILRGGWMGSEGEFPLSLLRNEGDGRFRDVTVEAGLLRLAPTQTAAWLDYDGDGWLDLFVGNETSRHAGPHPCELFRNEGDGTFTEVAAAVGVDFVGFVKGVTAGDVDNDGRPDLYLSVHGGDNVLFRNEGPMGGGGAGTRGARRPAAAGVEDEASEGGGSPGDPEALGPEALGGAGLRAGAGGGAPDDAEGRSGAGGHPAWRFTDVTAGAGVAAPRASFGTFFFDYDNDGWQDLFVAGYSVMNMAHDVTADRLGLPTGAERGRLYRNRGDGSFEDVTEQAGLDRVVPAMGLNFGDLDSDGWLDIYMGTGNPDLTSIVGSRMFRNDAGRRFQDVTTAGNFGHLQKGHAIGFGDVDNDGDQDVFAQMGGALLTDDAYSALYENPGTPNRWLGVELVGVRSNRRGLGARLAVTVESPEGRRTIHRTVGSGGSFGCSPFRQQVGLGAAGRVVALEVSWPASGETQRSEGLELDRWYEVREGVDGARPLELPSFSLPEPGTAPHHHAMAPD